MFKNVFNINLQMVNPAYFKSSIKVVQNDKSSIEFVVKLFNGTSEVDYSQISTADIVFKRDDDSVIEGVMTVNASSLNYVLGINEIAIPGKVVAAIQLNGLSGERLTTTRIQFEVVPDLIRQG